jgi:hypothetical protein
LKHAGSETKRRILIIMIDICCRNHSNVRKALLDEEAISELMVMGIRTNRGRTKFNDVRKNNGKSAGEGTHD